MSQEHKQTIGKPDFTLLSYTALLEAIKVREYGVIKYNDKDSWKKVKRDDYVKALIRHAMKLGLREEQRDEESKLHHAAHILVNAMFILEFDLEIDEQIAK